MLKQYLEAGIITSTHGVRGEVRIQPWANTPDFICSFEMLYIDGSPIKLISARPHKSIVIATLDGVDTIDKAIALKNKTVFINRDDAKLENGEYFITDLLGLKAIDYESGETLGTITDIMPLSPNQVYVISGNREILVPAVPDFVKEINPASGFISFKLIEGL